MRFPKRQVERVTDGLKRLRVQRVSPSRCTWEAAVEIFKRAWGEDFVDLGCAGVARIGVPAGPGTRSAARNGRRSIVSTATGAVR